MTSKPNTTLTKEEPKPALVPKLRFLEFRGEEAWKPVALQDASTPVTERVGERKLIPVSISAGIGFVPQAEKFGRDISGNQYQLYTLVKDGDFVFNKGNSLKFPQGCVYQLKGWGEVAVPNVFICFRLKKGYSDGFFQQCFEQNQHGRELKRHITSGARSNGLLNISKETFFGVEIPTPSPAEQQKIAECLSSLDEVIAAQARKLDALKTHKKGLMQQLFPREGETVPRLRFPEFQGKGVWIPVPMGEVYSFKGNNTLSRDKLNYVAGSVKNIHYGDIHTKFSTHFDITREMVPYINESELSVVRDVNLCAEGDMIFADASEDLEDIGKSIEIVHLNHERMVSGLHTILARPTGSRIALRFGGHLFKSPLIRTQIQKEAQGAKVLGISASRMQNIYLSLPHDKSEQSRIADCLSSLDELIAVQAKKVDALKTLKKGLMQQLFPTMEDLS
ncbi:MAG: restriction endonuclease subunit S [Prosthecobacter sp.]|nr:restriction endonuclease subunit S [Prosthecobacter sp.]